MKKVAIALAIMVTATLGWAQDLVQAGNPETQNVGAIIDVTATVPAYAAITVNPDIMFELESGAPETTAKIEKKVTVETNANIEVTFKADGRLSQTVGTQTYYVDTKYKVKYDGNETGEFGPDTADAGVAADDPGLDATNTSGPIPQDLCTIEEYIIDGTATLGKKISSQAAGNYKDAKIIVTVALK
jgi:hypothetical protein